MHRMRRFFASLAVIAPALATSIGGGSAHAALINPNAGRAYPDVAADINGVVTYNYNPSTSTGNFHVSNTPYLIAGGSGSDQMFDVSATAGGIRQQVLNVVLDSSGNIKSGDPGNTYSLYGSVTANGQTFSGLLLQGTPTSFGSQDLAAVGIQGSSVFDLNMNVTGGLLAPYFGPDAYMRIMPELQSTFEGKFDENFSAVKATSNTRGYHSPQPFPVPEPATLCVLVAGGAGVVLRRRRRAAMDRA